MTFEFKDHFSTQSSEYAQFRPTYPDELFQHLSAACKSAHTVLDCATGNGQAAIALSKYFSTVIAIDASQSQIDAAARLSNIRYHCAPAECTGLADNSVDLVTVAQAFHWFDGTAFFNEAVRVLRPSGVLAIWSYRLCTVSPACDVLLAQLYEEIVGPYWPEERAHVEAGYDDVGLPGEPLDLPRMRMQEHWTLAEMLGYLRTWSACKRYAADKGTDPVLQISAGLQAAWGNGARSVEWPLQITASRVNSLLE